jgi:hypothetical protein
MRASALLVFPLVLGCGLPAPELLGSECQGGACEPAPPAPVIDLENPAAIDIDLVSPSIGLVGEEPDPGEPGTPVPPPDDFDGDGVLDAADNCPELANDQHDEDDDAVGDACDLCPVDVGGAFEDLDGDGIGDDCDPHPFLAIDSIVDLTVFKEGEVLSPDRGNAAVVDDALVWNALFSVGWYIVGPANPEVIVEARLSVERSATVEVAVDVADGVLSQTAIACRAQFDDGQLGLGLLEYDELGFEVPFGDTRSLEDLPLVDYKLRVERTGGQIRCVLNDGLLEIEAPEVLTNPNIGGPNVGVQFEGDARILSLVAYDTDE